MSTDVLNQSKSVIVALINDVASSATQSAMGNIFRASADIGDKALVAIVKCRLNRRRQMCTEILGRADNRNHPAIVIFPAGEWSGAVRGTELTSGADDDAPIHWAMKVAAIMVNQLLPTGYDLRKKEPASNNSSTVVEGASVNVFADDFDAERAANEFAAGHTEYVDGAREATVIELRDDDVVLVQYDDNDERDSVRRARLQVVDDGTEDEFALSIEDDEPFYDYEDTSSQPNPPPRYDGYSGPPQKVRANTIKSQQTIVVLTSIAPVLSARFLRHGVLAVAVGVEGPAC